MKTSNGRIIAVIDETIEMFHNDKWTQGIFARDEAGNSMNVEDPRAVSFCLAGGLQRASKKVTGLGNPLTVDVINAVTETVEVHTHKIYQSLGPWNDSKTRTVEEVIAVLESTKQRLLR